MDNTRPTASDNFAVPLCSGHPNTFDASKSSCFKTRIGVKARITVYFNIMNLPRSIGCSTFFVVIETSRK